jgi:hypothetical protein
LLGTAAEEYLAAVHIKNDEGVAGKCSSHIETLRLSTCRKCCFAWVWGMGGTGLTAAVGEYILQSLLEC